MSGPTTGADDGAVYLVEADYPNGRGGLWTWRRRYFSKRAALRQAQRRREGWTYGALTWDDDDFILEPAQAVRLSVASVGAWRPIPPEEAD